jgi:hypothetical protein
MLTEMKGWARGERAWIACATRPLPVPCSPVMSTLASEGPMRAIRSRTGASQADWRSFRGALLAARSWFSCFEAR